MNLKNNQNIEKEENKKYGIDIYKKDFSLNIKFDNVNRTNVDRHILNEKGTNKQLILSENKLRKRTGIINNLQGKLDVQYLDFNKLKYQDDPIPSSTRNLNKSKEEIDFENNELKHNNEMNYFYNNISNNEIKDKNNKEETYIDNIKTESNFIEKEKKEINQEDLFKKIISIDLNIKISNEEVKLFLFNQIPKGETLISNINMNNEKTENNFLFNYYL